LVGFLIAAIQADDSSPDCGAQYFDQFKCMMALKETDEFKKIVDTKKPILKTCASDYPQSCIDEWEQMQTCCKKLSANWESDPDCVALKNETLTKVNTCFSTEPHDPLGDLEELFMPPGMGGHHRKGKHGHMGGDSGSMGGSGAGSTAKSGEKSDGGKGKEKSSKESPKSKREASGNGTASASSEEEPEAEEDDGPPPPPIFKRKECKPTKDQRDCVAKALSKADDSFKKALETLVQKKEDCETKVKHVCRLTTRPLKKCFWKAHENLFKKIFEKMQTCMKSGGGDKGGSGDKPSGSSNSTSTDPPKKDSRK